MRILKRLLLLWMGVGALLAQPQTAPRGFEHSPVEAEKPKGAGKTYALLIGVSRYQNDPPVTSLQFADKDAETFAELLATPIGGGLKAPDEIRLLTNEHATRASVNAELELLARTRGGKDNTLILFVGAHGVYLTEEEDPVTHKKVQKDPYILLFDTNINDAKTTGYPMEEFRRVIAEQTLHYGRVLVFLDVCHAANVAGIAGGSEVQDSVKKAWQGQAGEFGLMMASHAGESAIESTAFGGGHGAFSYFVVSGFNGAAAAGDTEITFADLAQYVRTNVRTFTRKAQDPFDQAPDTKMVIVADAGKTGLTLPPPKPLSDQDLRDIRRRRGVVAVGVSGSKQETAAGAAFDVAIANGLLLPEEAGSASRILAEARQSGPADAAALAEMERRLRVALEDRGQQVLSRYLEGEEIAQKEEDFSRCARWFETAAGLTANPVFDQSRAAFCRGRAEIFEHRYDEAQKELESAIQLDARRAYAYNAMGIAYLERIARTGSGFDEAERAFGEAMRFAPYWPYPVHNLALTRTERGDYDGAVALYRHAMAIAPRYSYLPYNLGLLYARLGDFENARAAFEKALEVQNGKAAARPAGAWPERARIWNALGTVASSEGRETKAREYFEKALTDDGSDVNARQNLALLLAKQGLVGEADPLWRRNLAEAPEFVPSRVAYAESLSSRGKVSEAIVQYEELVAREPGYVGAREALGRLYLRSGQANKALGEFDSAISRAGRTGDLLELRAAAEQAQGDRTGALRDLEEASRKAAKRADKDRIRRRIKGLARDSAPGQGSAVIP